MKTIVKPIIKFIDIVTLIFHIVLVPIVSIIFLFKGDIVLPIIGLLLMILYSRRSIWKAFSSLRLRKS